MKIQNFILVVAFAVICFAFNQKTDNKADKELVESLASMASEAFNSGDVSKALSIYTDDVVFLNGLIKISGKDSLAKSFTYMFQHSRNFRNFPAVFSVSDDMVFVEGLFTFDWNVENRVTYAKGVMIMVFKKQADNSWKITYAEENHGDILK